MATVADVIRVLIVDDDPLVCSGLALILGGAPSIEVIGQAGDGAEAVAAVRQLRPDVVLMDIRMPRLDGIEATARMSAAEPGVRVIVLTTFGADDYVLRALRSGAAGFLLKDTPPADIVAAVEKVHAGEPMLSPSVTATLIEQVTSVGRSPGRRQDARDRLGRLTDRELDVARGVGRGLSNAEIAGELHLSIPTIKAHIGRLFSKLEVDNRVQVALCLHDAQDHGV